MSDLRKATKFQSSVMKYPSGKYGIAGVPDEMAVEYTNKMGQKYHSSPIYETEGEAHKALKEHQQKYWKQT